MSAIISVLIFLVCAGMVVFMTAVLVIDMIARVDYLKEKVPRLRWVERKEWHGVLLLVCIFLLIGNGYELMTKEIPKASPPSPVFSPPHPPTIANREPPKDNNENIDAKRARSVLASG